MCPKSFKLILFIELQDLVSEDQAEISKPNGKGSLAGKSQVTGEDATRTTPTCVSIKAKVNRSTLRSNDDHAREMWQAGNASRERLESARLSHSRAARKGDLPVAGRARRIGAGASRSRSRRRGLRDRGRRRPPGRR